MQAHPTNGGYVAPKVEAAAGRYLLYYSIVYHTISSTTTRYDMI